MEKECPKCGLINPTDSERCDCGYDFESRTIQASYIQSRTSSRDPSGHKIKMLKILPIAFVLALIHWFVAGIFLFYGEVVNPRASNYIFSGIGMIMLLPFSPLLFLWPKMEYSISLILGFVSSLCCGYLYCWLFSRLYKKLKSA